MEVMERWIDILKDIDVDRDKHNVNVLLPLNLDQWIELARYIKRSNRADIIPLRLVARIQRILTASGRITDDEFVEAVTMGM